jgi:hypothetical protein
MAKIIINPPRGVDLADEFLKALSLLHSNGIKPRTGTKLVSRYAVVVVDDGIADKTVAQLNNANIAASPDSLRPLSQQHSPSKETGST